MLSDFGPCAMLSCDRVRAFARKNVFRVSDVYGSFYGFYTFVESLKSIGRSVLEIQRLVCKVLPTATLRKMRFLVGGCPYTCPLHAAVKFSMFSYPAITAGANMAFLTNIDGES